MTRQSISLTEPNNEWLVSQVENVQDYSNKSELINDLIRRARRSEFINKKLELAEKSGFVKQTAAEILDDIKTEIR